MEIRKTYVKNVQIDTSGLVQLVYTDMERHCSMWIRNYGMNAT